MRSRILSDGSGSSNARAEALATFWAKVVESGDSGQAPMEVLDRMLMRVVACLELGAGGLDMAEAITAEAMLMMAGQL